jgi:hypothetical protein
MSMIITTTGSATTLNLEDITAQVWKEANPQQSKLKDYIRDLHRTVQEKDSTGKIESTTQIEKKQYFKQPDKNFEKFLRATKDGKPVSEKDLQPGMLVSSFRKPSEELAEEMMEELKSITMFSPFCKDKFDFKLLREDIIEGNNTWVLEALSRSKELKVKRVILWIDQGKMRTIKVEAESIENPSSFVKKIKVSSSLSEVIPGIFLPKATKIETSLSKISSKHLETLNEFSNYKINVGLEDSLFQKK